jgi:hypothetical protein
MKSVLYPAENNMAFQEKSDKLYTQNNAQYFGFPQLLAKFDSVTQDYIAAF